MRVLIPLFLLVTGCASASKKYEERLRSWEGHSATELVQMWGAPHSNLSLPDGGTVYEYNYGSQHTTGFYNRTISAYQSFTSNRYCRTTFIADPAGIIRSWRWEGNACRAD